MLHNTAGALSFTTASLSHPDLQRLTVLVKRYLKCFAPYAQTLITVHGLL